MYCYNNGKVENEKDKGKSCICMHVHNSVSFKGRNQGLSEQRSRQVVDILVLHVTLVVEKKNERNWDINSILLLLY